MGLVTNTRVTHATPAAAYARSADRGWEGDSLMDGVQGGCKDIARQLLEDNPDIKVRAGWTCRHGGQGSCRWQRAFGWRAVTPRFHNNSLLTSSLPDN